MSVKEKRMIKVKGECPKRKECGKISRFCVKGLYNDCIFYIINYKEE